MEAAQQRLCKGCGEPIPEARLKALPYTRTCVKCSSEQPVKGNMIITHKTGSALEVISPSAHQWLKDHDRRGTYGSNLPMERKK